MNGPAPKATGPFSIETSAGLGDHTAHVVDVAVERHPSAIHRSAVRLLDIPEAGPAGHAERMEILSLIKESRRRKADLPSHEEMQRRHRHGAAFRAGPTGEYLTGWLDERRWAGDLAETTLTGYRTHVARMLRSSMPCP